MSEKGYIRENHKTFGAAANSILERSSMKKFRLFHRLLADDCNLLAVTGILLALLRKLLALAVRLLALNAYLLAERKIFASRIIALLIAN